MWGMCLFFSLDLSFSSSALATEEALFSWVSIKFLEDPLAMNCCFNLSQCVLKSLSLEQILLSHSV